MTLQLDDRSIRRPQGIVSDVLVKVGRLIFPTDFMILYVNEDAEVLIILRLTISFHFLCSLGRPMQEDDTLK